MMVTPLIHNFTSASLLKYEIVEIELTWNSSSFKNMLLCGEEEKIRDRMLFLRTVV